MTTSTPLSSASSAHRLDPFPPTRDACLQRLEEFLPRAGDLYARTRNFDYGPDRRANISGLSPYTRTRLVHEGDIVTAVLREHSPQAAEKFIQEVFWRTYWKGWLEMRPGLWERYLGQVDVEFASLRTMPDRDDRYRRAVAGETGIECFDAWARELVEIGYVHNHARMWFASIWVFTLGLPWQLGADFYFRHLLDGDPASNTLSWRWVAGLQTRGKHYLARASNIVRYTEGRFDPHGELKEDTEPLEPESPDPRRDIVAMAPVVSGLATGVLLHTEDLSLETCDAVVRLEPRAVAGSFPEALVRQHRLDDKVAGFRRAALEDGLERAGAAFGVKPRRLDDGAGTQSGIGEPEASVEAFVTAVVTWARDEALERVVMAAPMVGPWRPLVQCLERGLGEAQIELAMIRRRWDLELHGHAVRGFFPFKKKIPAALERLDELL